MFMYAVICSPISKMNSEDAKTALHNEIVKCWDDGEVANYDRLTILAKKGGVNTQTEVGFISIGLCIEGMDCSYGCYGKPSW